MAKKTKAKRGVVVTTAHRGVFFGYLARQAGDTVWITKARNCVYWSDALHGFLGLAKEGPNAQCRVGPNVSKLQLLNVTSVADCTPVAVKAWEAEPWS